MLRRLRVGRTTWNMQTEEHALFLTSFLPCLVTLLLAYQTLPIEYSNDIHGAFHDSDGQLRMEDRPLHSRFCDLQAYADTPTRRT